MGMTLRIEVFTTDPGRSVEFYRRVLRFTGPPGAAADGYTALQRDGVTIGVSPHPDPAVPEFRRPPTGTEIVLEVDDLDAEFAIIRDSGWPIDAPITEQPWGLRDFRILDPDGYYLRFTHRR
ncbi:VOC family protein [Microlunatus speluncae]|uniref:VOC family protein n=1 Tax=Microlunatus speluncae TaxID=2594267 RepID=UPI0012664DED|nr:VOC family protein [Microlunatus speluncae]